MTLSQPVSYPVRTSMEADGPTATFLGAPLGVNAATDCRTGRDGYATAHGNATTGCHSHRDGNATAHGNATTGCYTGPGGDRLHYRPSSHRDARRATATPPTDCRTGPVAWGDRHSRPSSATANGNATTGLHRSRGRRHYRTATTPGNATRPTSTSTPPQSRRTRQRRPLLHFYGDPGGYWRGRLQCSASSVEDGGCRVAGHRAHRSGALPRQVTFPTAQVTLGHRPPNPPPNWRRG